MMLAFVLDMPTNKSWNGKWSGSERKYVRVIKRPAGKANDAKSQAILDGGTYSHRFRDGWVASITVTKVDSAEARKLTKMSDGFCGYDWMITNIISHGSPSPIETPQV